MGRRNFELEEADLLPLSACCFTSSDHALRLHISRLYKFTMPEHPTTSWEPMQDGHVFYRRQQIYSIPNKLPKLDDFIIAGCRHGGPLGALQRTRLLTGIQLKLRGPTSCSTHAGYQQNRFGWPVLNIQQIADPSLLSCGRGHDPIQCGYWSLYVVTLQD